jgi:hypothetical protein
VDDNGGGCVGGGRRWRSGHRSRDDHKRDGEAGIGVGDGAIGSRMREHPRGNNERGRSGRFNFDGGAKACMGARMAAGASRTRRGVGSGCRGCESSGAGRRRRQHGDDPEDCDGEGEGKGVGDA